MRKRLSACTRGLARTAPLAAASPKWSLATGRVASGALLRVLKRPAYASGGSKNSGKPELNLSSFQESSCPFSRAHRRKISSHCSGGTFIYGYNSLQAHALSRHVCAENATLLLSAQPAARRDGNVAWRLSAARHGSCKRRHWQRRGWSSCRTASDAAPLRLSERPIDTHALTTPSARHR